MKILAPGWSNNLKLSPKRFSKWQPVVFVKVTDEKVSNFKENAVPNTTKEVEKWPIIINYFRGKKLRCRTVLNFILLKTSLYLNRCKIIETFVYICKNVFSVNRLLFQIITFVVILKPSDTVNIIELLSDIPLAFGE